ncbi:MAG: ABC transporter permease [Spirochaetota bacterium]
MATSQTSARSANRDLRGLILGIIGNREIFLIIFIVLFGFIASRFTPYFLNMDNFRQILIAIALDGTVAVGMTIVLVGGGIDLSVGSIIGLSSAIIGLSFKSGLGIPAALLLAVAAGVLVGAVNGTLISYVKINPIITTLAFMGIARSVTYIVSGGYAFSSIPAEFVAFAAGSVLNIPNTAIVALTCVLVFHFLLNRSVLLRKYFYIGGNEAAAFKAGLRVNRYKFMSYVIVAAFSSLAAILLVSRLGSTFPHSGLGTELRVVSACIIGGCSMNGGKGTILGSFLGVLLLGLISNILVLLNVSVYWQGIATGIILVLAVASDALISDARK